ncbi:hypothetical protein BurJ1DRAFT_4748 [Burkholderiales bacterium JOSHI_001]|nr:hypothetical protein BurJ1DRAFT_4748 [Burkholderiales bacterium JOSHI_001]
MVPVMPAAPPLPPGNQPLRPRQVLLFSGHLMDAPDRAVPRFPPAMEAAARQAIDAELDRLGAGPADLARAQAAAGGDLLFLQACQRRGLQVQVLLPFDEARFLDESVRGAAFNREQGDWVGRYQAVRQRLTSPPRLMPDELGPLPTGADAFEQCNLWLLNTALAAGADRLNFICLWNGGGGDGPGGTAHMVNEVKRRGGSVCWIDTRRLGTAPG